MCLYGSTVGKSPQQTIVKRGSHVLNEEKLRNYIDTTSPRALCCPHVPMFQCLYESNLELGSLHMILCKTNMNPISSG